MHLLYAVRMRLLFFVIILVVVSAGAGWRITHRSSISDTEVSDQGSEDTTKTSNIELANSNASDDTALNLSHKGLTQVPSSVFAQKGITKLDLSKNKLTGALQAEIRNLQNLEILDLSDNQFTGVPAEIGQLGSLEILDLSNNQLTGLPYELGNLSKLRELDLRGNEYSEVDLSVIRKNLPADTVILVD